MSLSENQVRIMKRLTECMVYHVTRQVELMIPSSMPTNWDDLRLRRDVWDTDVRQAVNMAEAAAALNSIIGELGENHAIVAAVTVSMPDDQQVEALVDALSDVSDLVQVNQRWTVFSEFAASAADIASSS